MRLKMASAVEGCLYRRLNVVPGRPSRYSNDRREDADIVSIADLSRLFDVVRCYLSIMAEALDCESGERFARAHESPQIAKIFPVATLRSDQPPHHD